MSDPLPDTIKPQSLIDNGGHIGGYCSLAKMDRLSALLSRNDGVVEANLDFGKDSQGIRFIKGRLQTELLLHCQRCLETVSYPVDLTAGEQVNDLPDSYDPLVIDAQSLSLTTVIEDELLLALPIVAKHQETECVSSVTSETGDSYTDEKPNPFAELAQLKGKLNPTQ
jgi:uncharacterized protein